MEAALGDYEEFFDTYSFCMEAVSRYWETVSDGLYCDSPQSRVTFSDLIPHFILLVYGQNGKHAIIGLVNQEKDPKPIA